MFGDDYNTEEVAVPASQHRTLVGRTPTLEFLQQPTLNQNQNPEQMEGVQNNVVYIDNNPTPESLPAFLENKDDINDNPNK